MERSDIREGLSKFVDEYTSQTNIGTFREQKRESLLADGLGTRANSIWKMAEYIIAYKADDGIVPKEEYLKGWAELTKNYKDQHLLLEIDDEGHWEMYDAYGYFIGGNDEINEYFKKLAGKVANQAVKPVDSPDDEKTPLQVIYYGAPGTGKSHKVSKIVKNHEDHTFRVTFHPDSDYASFVGSYKPISRKSIVGGQIYSAAELTKLYKAFKASGESRPVHKFSAFYFESLDRLTAAEQYSIFTSNGETKDTASSEVPKGKAVGEYLDRAWKKNADSGKVSYEFSPQAFTKAYIDAWKNPSEKVYLVIEEINRGNCAQIFGDLFQLLDRNDEGISKYPVKPDDDLLNYLKQRDNLGLFSGGVENDCIKLPANLYVLATMNTSDQSLFPMDVAFKRRWAWEYIKIEYTDAALFTLNIANRKTYNWEKVLRALNTYIKDKDNASNKLIGNRFVQISEGTEISYPMFRDKVLFYLFGDVFKDNDDFAAKFFGKHDGYRFFEDLCEKDDPQITIDFLDDLLGEEEQTEDGDQTPGTEDR